MCYRITVFNESSREFASSAFGIDESRESAQFKAYHVLCRSILMIRRMHNTIVQFAHFSSLVVYFLRGERMKRSWLIMTVMTRKGLCHLNH